MNCQIALVWCTSQSRQLGIVPSRERVLADKALIATWGDCANIALNPFVKLDFYDRYGATLCHKLERVVSLKVAESRSRAEIAFPVIVKPDNQISKPI